MKITDDHVKMFRRTFNLPIPMDRAEYLNYFIELLDPYYDVKEKWNIFETELSLSGNDIFQKTRALRERMDLDIRNSEGYKKFNDFNVKDLDYKPIPHKDLYVHENKDKIFLSIDLVKANFQSFVYKGFDIFNGALDFEEFVDQYDESIFMKKSKILRQILFGNLNPKKQQSIQKEMIHKIAKKINEEFIFEKDFVSLSSDEIYVETDESMVSNINKIEEIINELGINVRVELFQLIQPFENKVFYKKFIGIDKPHSFALVPRQNIAQFIKMINEQDIQKEDLLFINENGRLSQYIELMYRRIKDEKK